MDPHAHTFLDSTWTSRVMISKREIISEAYNSARLARSRDSLRVSASTVDHKLKVDRTSLLGKRDRDTR